MFLLTVMLILVLFPSPLHEAGDRTVDRLSLSSRGEADMPKRLVVIATAYTAFDEGMDGRGITYCGTTVKEHYTIAVDPDVIPLGSVVYIPALSHLESAGFYVAEDTGSAIKGNRIDIYMPDRSQALQFGVRQLEIYVVGRRTACGPN